jgi:ferrous iron transport protein B
MKPQIVAALSGNPNSGKTTIFNNLTGARQHVGNYPGVTVERKEGFRRYSGVDIRIIDLPGVYGLTVYSEEERVAREVLIGEKVDVVVDIMDAPNLQRNLYLAVEIMELGLPLVLVFNMSDAAKARGYEFNIAKLSQVFGALIVQSVGHKGVGMKEILDAIVAKAADGAARQVDRVVYYGLEIEEEIAAIEGLLKDHGQFYGKCGTRWLAVKLLENDSEAGRRISSAEIRQQVAKSISRIEHALKQPPETAIASRRYEFISEICRETVRSSKETRRTTSDRIDAVLMHHVFGLPIFLALMFLVFHLTFTLGEAPMHWTEQFFGWLSGALESCWPSGSDSVLKSLLVDGIIGGVGGVIVFLPNILLLFLAIAILEDSGYMARAAFIMDRLMHKIGLPGKSFIPMLIGFGCSVPAIMATRTLENRRDRLATMLVIPLMSCGARLPIYALLIPAFFSSPWHAPMLWIIYVIGIALAVVSAKVLRGTLLKGDSVPFVMELPPYRMPAVRGLLIHMWGRGGLYLKKAGTIILVISILLWAITAFPRLPDSETARLENVRRAIQASSAEEGEKTGRLSSVDNEESEMALRHSIAGRIGNAMEPLLKPMGFDWKIGTALVGAFAAKEVFVSQMGIVYSVGNADEEPDALRERLRSHYTPLVAFCVMLFCLISTPCMATVAVVRRESNSWKWALFQFGGLTLLAYLLTAFVFQAGSLLGIGV